MSADYQPGDIVKVSRTIEVVESRFNDSEYVQGKDVQSGLISGCLLTGSAKLEMVKRVPRKSSRKPPVGAHLTGADVGRVQWKRGTVIHHLPAGRGAELVLHEDGRWHSVSNLSQVTTFEFDDLNRDAKFEIKYLP